MQSWFGRAIHGTGLAVFAEILARMSNTIFFILLTWQTNQIEASTFSVGFIYTGLLAAFCLGGLEQLLNREASRNITESQVTLGNFLLARTVTSLLIFGGLCVWLFQFSTYNAHTLAVIILIGSTLIPESLTNLFQSFFIAAQRLSYIVTINTIAGIVRVVLGGSIIWIGGNSVSVAFVISITSWLSMLAYFILVGNLFFWPAISLQPHLWKQYAQAEIPLFMMALMASLESNFDGLLLSNGGRNDIVLVGAYNAAGTLLNALLIIPNSFRQIILSIFASIYHKDRKKTYIIYEQSIRLLLFLSLFICLIVTFYAEHLISLLYRRSFSAAIPVLQILIWSFLWMMLLVPNGRLMLTAGIQHKAVLPQLAGMLLNISLNLALQPHYNVVGAAIAKVSSATLVCLWCWWIVWRDLHAWQALPVLWPAIGASLATFSFFVLSLPVQLPWILAAILTTLIYLVTLYLLGGIRAAELQALQRWLRLRNQHSILGGK